MGKKKDEKRQRRLDKKVPVNRPPEATKYHVEKFEDGRWQSVATFDTSERALRGLASARDAALARYRVTDDTAKVHLDIPVIGS